MSAVSAALFLNNTPVGLTNQPLSSYLPAAILPLFEVELLAFEIRRSNSLQWEL
jgi:hypothetical protein